jgi:hypothetical protein
MGVKLGASGRPDDSDLARAARPRVVVRTVLDLPA